MESTKPRVLVLGSTGLTGKAIAAELDDASDRVEVVRASRDPEAVERWRAEGQSAVRLDLDDAGTFASALWAVLHRDALLDAATAIPQPATA